MRIRWACAFVVLLGMGCGGPPRHQLSGAVTYQGKPVPAGEILFMPDPAAGNKGPGLTAVIKAGHYELPAGKGHVGGAYVARITGFDGVAPPPSEEPVDARGSVLFADRVEKFELPAGSATQDFHIN